MVKRLSLKDPVELRSAADALIEAALPPHQDHRHGDAAAVERLLLETPDAARENIWVAAITGELEAVRGFLTGEPELAGMRGGTRSWEPLLYLCFSRLLRADSECASAMVEIARLLLDNGADPNVHWIDEQEASGNKETPLYGAAGVANNPELARLLIEAGADPDDGETAYHMVEHDGVSCAEVVFPKLSELHQGIALGHKVDYDDLRGFRKLLELGGDPNGKTPFAYDPIHMAVWRGRSKLFFDLLFEHGADVNRKNREKRTAYAMAARAGKSAIMGWLAEAGASTEMSPVDTFIASAAAGDAESARRLLDKKRGLFQKLTPRDRGEICEAAAAGNLEGVRAMLDVGWDVDTKNVVWGETAAHRAAMHGHLDLVRMLVERGTDLTITDRTYNGTPPAWAAYGEARHVVEYFKTVPDRLDIWDAIELGATERALALLPDTDVDTAIRGASEGVLLRLAVGRGNLRLVEAFLDQGADPTIKTPYGMCAIDVAREAGHGAIAELLGSRESR